MRACTSASFWNWDRSRASMAAVIAAPVSSLRVGFAAGVAVRLDQDGVVQVLKGGGQGAGHRQVAQHIATPEQVERGPAGPAGRCSAPPPPAIGRPSRP